MAIMSGNFPKAMVGGKSKKTPSKVPVPGNLGKMFMKKGRGKK
jgi:hypothetical protein